MQSKKILLEYSKRTFSSSPIAFLRLIFPDVPFGWRGGRREKKEGKLQDNAVSSKREGIAGACRILLSSSV